MGDIRCSAILSCSEATFEIPKTYRTFRGRRVSHVAAPHAARHALNTSQRCDRHAQVAGAYHTLTMWALASCLAIGVLAAVLALARLARVALPVDHDPATRKCTSLAFFHPFAECGGGGERVLWAAVDALAKEDALTKPSKVKEREDSEQSAQSEQFGESGELEEGMRYRDLLPGREHAGGDLGGGAGVPRQLEVQPGRFTSLVQGCAD